MVWVGFPANAHREINLLLPKKFPSTRFSLQNAYIKRKKLFWLQKVVLEPKAWRAFSHLVADSGKLRNPTNLVRPSTIIERGPINQREAKQKPKQEQLFRAEKVFSLLRVWVGLLGNAYQELNLLPPKKFLSTRFSLQNACKIT